MLPPYFKLLVKCCQSHALLKFYDCSDNFKDPYISFKAIYNFSCNPWLNCFSPLWVQSHRQAILDQTVGLLYRRILNQIGFFGQPNSFTITVAETSFYFTFISILHNELNSNSQSTVGVHLPQRLQQFKMTAHHHILDGNNCLSMISTLLTC